MAEYILSLLRAQLMVVFSWGLHNPTELPNNEGLAFLVNGYKHQGWVFVKYNDGVDLFDVELRKTDMQLVKTIREVYFDRLVDVIDCAIEKTADYDERVKKQYNIQK